MRNCCFALVAFTLAFCAASELTAGGLSTNLGEVIITGLERGEKYSLRNLANIPLSVVNRGEDTVMVRVSVLVPDSVELRQGAEPIPSTDWVSLESDSLLLAPEQMGISDVFIQIPNDTALTGRKFQVMLWSRTIPGPGVLIACGLKSRIIFSTAEAGSAHNTGNADEALGLDGAGNADGGGSVDGAGNADDSERADDVGHAEDAVKVGDTRNPKINNEGTHKKDDTRTETRQGNQSSKQSGPDGGF